MSGRRGPVGGERSVVVFLSKSLGQSEAARGSALRIPGVTRVTFAGFCPSVMFVYSGTVRGA